ncbi:MAG: twin-arginine translocase subunit TatC [Candidatus Binatia bacterium]
MSARQSHRQISDDAMPFTSHLAELRSRLIKSFLALAVAFAGCFAVADHIFAVLAAPLKRLDIADLHLVGTAVTEAFFTKMKVAFAGAIIVALPVLLWQAWQFVAPGLYEHEKRYTRAFVAFGSLFFFAGAVFSYEVLIGQGLGFLLRRYAAINVQPWIQVGNYFSISVRLVLAGGVMFQLPVLAFFFARVGLIDHRFLIRHFRYAVIGMAILAAVLTPPDFVAQIFFMVPLSLLYGVSIGVAYLARRRETDGE